jgi:hypothetical protein
MKHLLLLGISFLLIFAACKKDHPTVNTPVPVPLPVDDTARVMLKDIVTTSLPSPYYHFEYSGKYTSTIGFADNMQRYNLQYENKRLIKMINTRNDDQVLYSYTDGKVSMITEISGASGKKTWKYYFKYNNLGQLEKLSWMQFASNGVDSMLYRKALLLYHSDGNLASIDNYRLNAAGDEVIWSSTIEYSNYDSAVNVDDFSLFKDFFETLLYLPAVKLQKNNPRMEIITGTQNDYKITHSYQYNNKLLPVTNTATLTQTRGTGTGQPLTVTTSYSYY